MPNERRRTNYDTPSLAATSGKKTSREESLKRKGGGVAGGLRLGLGLNSKAGSLGVNSAPPGASARHWAPQLRRSWPHEQGALCMGRPCES